MPWRDLLIVGGVCLGVFALAVCIGRASRTPNYVCESCGRVATVQLQDGSTWCGDCDTAAMWHELEDPEP